jgi:pilus assembly protein CpaC
MHRTTPVPRRTCWSLLLSLLIVSAAAHTTAAQQEILPPPAGELAGQVSALPVPVNTTKRIEMSNKEIIKEVRNENPKVVRVQSIVDDPRAVLVTGLAVGTSRLTFVDINKKTELLDVRVPDQSNLELEQRRAKILEMIHNTVPTAAVDATVTGTNTVVLTGTAPSADAVQTILETTRGAMQVLGGPQALIYNGMKIGGVQQVQLEVVVALVNRSRLRQASFNFITQGNRFFATSAVGTGSGSPLSTLSNFMTLPFGLPSATSNLASSPNVNFGILGNNVSFLGFLEALNTESIAKVLAEPRVTTLSGRPAIFSSGGQTPILTSGGVGAPSVSYKSFGTVVNFLPIILANGRIHLEIDAQLSSINAANGVTIASGGSVPTSVPGFNVRQAQVAVEVEDGQTLAIGGLIQNTINATITRVPVLGDIPFLNVLFTAKKYSEEEEELLILVTPRLVDPMTCSQIPQLLPGRETRSPDDFELFLEGILEAPRGPRHVSFTPHGYKGAHMNSPNAGQYPCPGGGYLGFNGTGVPVGVAAPPAAPYSGLLAGTATSPNTGGSIPNSAPATDAVRGDAASATPPVRNQLPPGSAAGLPTGRDPENRPVLPPAGFSNRE